MTKTATIEWAPFSEKHKEYIRNALNSRMSVAEGAIRSGKTIDHCIISAIYLETCPDKLHLATGSTVANAKTNIGDCNGYGLQHLFRGRCRKGIYEGNECLYIDTQTGHKVVIFAGGGKADSYKKILGNSYGLWLATEINQHYDSPDSETSFIKVAMGRQIAAKKPLTLWDLNPSNPRHPIYADYIDRYKESFSGGYNYQHFTIADNLSVSAERKAELISNYGGNINSVWYRRDILGERCTAEGLVYQQYADNPNAYAVEFGEIADKILAVNIGVDFGGNKSATTFVCTAFTHGFRKVVPILSERHTERLNPETLATAFALFLHKCYAKTGRPMKVYADNAETVLIGGLQQAVLREHLPVSVDGARKMPISDRIHLINKLVAQGRFGVCVEAETVKSAMCEVIFDPKSIDDRRLDNCTTDVDTCDALEYSIEPYYEELKK